MQSVKRNRPINIVEKLWGREYWYENGDYCIKKLLLNPGYETSLHYHEVKKETFICESGTVKVEVKVDDSRVIYLLKPGNLLTIDPMTAHRLSSSGGVALLIECSTHHEDSDSYRIEKSRGSECT